VLSRFFFIFLIFISYNVYSQNNAIMRAIDRSTGRSLELVIPLNKDIKFSNLLINVKYCYKNPIDKEIENYAYLIVKDLLLNKEIFEGWMLSSSPSLSSLEHPVNDIWLLNCNKSD